MEDVADTYKVAVAPEEEAGSKRVRVFWGLGVSGFVFWVLGCFGGFGFWDVWRVAGLGDDWLYHRSDVELSKL